MPVKTSMFQSPKDNRYRRRNASIDNFISVPKQSLIEDNSVLSSKTSTDQSTTMPPRPEGIATVFIKIFKLILNLIILILYRVGDKGRFLGVGGTWNLNEEKNPDAEIVASGVLVGFLIYTIVVMLSYCFGGGTKHKGSIVDIMMNFVGTFMFIAVGGTALHYWHGYQSEYDYVHVSSERQIGLAVGSLSIIAGATYLIDTILAFLIFAQSEE
ncbi:Protein snakeskin [Gryllus bimaculatus]|nr:Protein snakeskin [Gryllus bimaculatus]